VKITIERSAVEAAIAAMESWSRVDRVRALSDLLRALEEVIPAEQEAEPPYIWYDDATGETWAPEAVAANEIRGLLRPLYAHPPRREWRGLTEEEIKDIYVSKYWYEMGEFTWGAAAVVARAIESILRERNA
jgi:hypothetical protein